MKKSDPAPYTYADLVEAYGALGVAEGRVVYVTSDVGRLMAFEKLGKAAVLEAHFQALMELLGPTGTLVMPSASLNLCNTDISFDLEKTPSLKSGMLSEYIRQKEGARRSFHPFVSYTAIGARADEITQNVARHAFGPETPEARMVESDTLSVSVGLFPRFTCSTIHHVEHVTGVPYRYTKEYLHPVVREGKTLKEPFYQHVLYLNSDVDRSACKHIFKFEEIKRLFNQEEVGRGVIYSYQMRDFFNASVKLFMDDIYIWCEKHPDIRPWRE